jgi:hypothetical protein
MKSHGLTAVRAFNEDVRHDQAQDLAGISATATRGLVMLEWLTLAKSTMALTDVSTSRGCMMLLRGGCFTATFCMSMVFETRSCHRVVAVLCCPVSRRLQQLDSHSVTVCCYGAWCTAA